MTTVTNSQPSWRSYMATGNPADIVPSPTVAAQFAGKVDAVDGQIGPTTALFHPSAGSVEAGDIVADYFFLRARGCALDGKTDDRVALQSVIDACASSDTNSIPRLHIMLPPYVDLLLSGPVSTASCWTHIRSHGLYGARILMASGGAGAIVHGTAASPAQYALQVENIWFQDANASGSGVPAINAYFTATNMSGWSALVMDNVVFRRFSQAVLGTNVPRDALLRNCFSYGPDGKVSDSAFKFVGSSDNTHGCYTFNGINCRSVNHLFLFDFYSDTQMEGGRFYNCTAYAGGGLCRIYVNATPASLPGVTTYQSPLWYFTDCDWQGQGPAFDLYRVSGCIIRGGFLIADALSSAPPSCVYTGPNGDTYQFRSYVRLKGCDGVYMDRVRMDANAYMESVWAMVYVCNDTTYFHSDLAHVQSSATSGYGFCYEAGGQNNRCRALDTQWAHWAGGNKIYDPDGTQIEQEAVYDPVNDIYYGNVDRGGLYEIDLYYDNLIADSNNQYSVTYPVMRQAKGQLFNGTPPFPSIVPHNGTGAACPSITVVNYTATGCVFALSGASSSYEGNFKISLRGR
ncbi:hypothetical protein [Gluconobacter oxydans]|uniref:hypothetical protein n=1 Tax=Gluconobacter oxydans TaxID=442 RepID=UPI0039EBB4EB